MSLSETLKAIKATQEKMKAAYDDGNSVEVGQLIDVLGFLIDQAIKTREGGG